MFNSKFPRSIERGPVEAFGDDFWQFGLQGQFPRSIERGPVEAMLLLAILAVATLSFRAQLSAAPLKLDLKYSIKCSASGFPRSIERGPVEPERLV